MRMPTPEEALPGRSAAMPVPDRHYVSGAPMTGAFEGMEIALFGMGCFWGAERMFWEAPGVYSTAVGYAAGHTPNPSYQEVCSGLTGHNEVVRVVFDPERTDYAALLTLFWEGHDPTQGMRQGNDLGTQYRSGAYPLSDAQRRAAAASAEAYQQVLSEAGRGCITTEVVDAPEFYFAEAHHQQYLAKNPGGYCRMVGSGVRFPAARALTS